MNTILDQIVIHKKQELLKTKQKISIKDLENTPLFERPCYSLHKHLKDANKTGIIAEFKRKSPSKGVLNDLSPIEKVTAKYTEFGASGLSILTNTHFFQGFPKDIQKARKNEVPILRKEFIIDEFQILEAKALGADVILLIAECLTSAEVKTFTQLAQSLGMEVILELHSSQQVEKISIENNLIGINNRDLTSFKVDIERSIKLSHLLPKESLKIAESGISAPATILRMKQAGFEGFLMGEHFMKKPQPGEAFKDFIATLKSTEYAV